MLFRSERDKLRQDEGFQKEFKTQIQAFKKATNEEATLAFQSLAIDLKSRGFASEQVQTIIDALREESGKTDVKFDVKSIDFSPESIKSIQGNLTKNLNVLKKTYQNGFKKIIEYKPTGTYGGVTLVEKLVPTKELERQLANVSSFISTTAKSAGTMFENGIITGDQYTQTINTITQQMNALDAAQRKAVLVKVFQEMGVGADALIANLKDAKQQIQQGIKELKPFYENVYENGMIEKWHLPKPMEEMQKDMENEIENIDKGLQELEEDIVLHEKRLRDANNVQINKLMNGSSK